MQRNSAWAIEHSIRSGRALLRTGIDLEQFQEPTPSALPHRVDVAKIASMDARSESFRIGEASAVVLDEVQARWIYALCLIREDSAGKLWPIYALWHYLVIRLVASGLQNEARALSERLRAETRRLHREDGFDVTASRVGAARIERFIQGHELGHVAYRAPCGEIQELLRTVHSCASDLTRLLRVTLTGDRTLLLPSEQDPRVEDIADSMTDYLNRFIFHEYAEDIRKYERDLLARSDVLTLEARRRRYEALADKFETVDFLEEAFCDLYALEFRLLDVHNSPSAAAEVAMEVWQNLHAMFALAAMDSLARDRLVAARASFERNSALKGVDPEAMTEDAVAALHKRIADVEATRYADQALLHYQLSMLKAVYRRVVFMNYVARHPLLAKPELIQVLEQEGEQLEGQFIGACASLRFNGIRLELDRQAGFGDTLAPASRTDLDRLWRDIVVRVPGMDDVIGQSPVTGLGQVDASTFRPRCRCDFCGRTALTERLIVTSGRAAICDQCALTTEAAFAAMPTGQPRRAEVAWGILSSPPSEPIQRSDPYVPHCCFCEIAPALGEPLVSSDVGGTICGICADAAAKIVRMVSKGSDPAYFASAQKRLDNMTNLAEESSSTVVRESMQSLADSLRAEIERERHPILPGREIWRLFTEPTLEPDIPRGAKPNDDT